MRKRLKRLPKLNKTGIAFYTDDLFYDLTKGKAKKPLIMRDFNTLIKSLYDNLQKMGYDTSTLEYAEVSVLDDEFLCYLKNNKKMYSPRNIRKYWEGLSDEDKQRLWVKNNLTETFNQFFIPLPVTGLDPDNSVLRVIPGNIRDDIKAILCKHLEYPLEYVHILPQLMTLNEITEDGTYINNMAKLLCDNINAKKPLYDEYKGSTSKVFYIPVCVRSFSLNNILSVKKVSESAIDADMFLDEDIKNLRLSLLDICNGLGENITLDPLYTYPLLPFDIVTTHKYAYLYKTAKTDYLKERIAV